MKNSMTAGRLMTIFGYLMAMCIFAFGVLIIFLNTFEHIPKMFRVIFGVFLMLYSFYRFVNIYYKSKNSINNANNLKDIDSN